MRPAKRPYWYIDYLRKKTTLEAVWCRYAQKSLECQLGETFLFDGRCGGADGRPLLHGLGAGRFLRFRLKLPLVQRRLASEYLFQIATISSFVGVYPRNML